MMRYACFFLFTLAVSFSARAREYPVSSASELSQLSLQPGDRVVLKEGPWKDQDLVFHGNGTEKAPITLISEKPGSFRLTGQSHLKIDGSWLVVDGLYFTDGYSQKEDVIVFTPRSEHCRLTNTAIVAYNPSDKKLDYKWVSVWGHQNRVDHCWLEGKTHQGTTLVIWLDGKPNYDQIDHNYFGARPDLGVNGGETIRIGNSTWSLHDSYTTVEKNIFHHCNGEIEIVSNKSCRNTIRDNLFYECAGTLTLRHGHYADVSGNYFIGNGLPNTGGVRVIAENHHVHDNYFQDLTGTGLSAAVSIMDGLPNPQLTSHWQVKNALIDHNVFIRCRQSLSIGAGKNAERYLRAENTSFTDNLIVSDQPALSWADDSVRLTFRNNMVWGTADNKNLPEGFLQQDAGLKKDGNNLYYRKGASPVVPFWKTEPTGPAWRKSEETYRVASLGRL